MLQKLLHKFHQSVFNCIQQILFLKCFVNGYQLKKLIASFIGMVTVDPLHVILIELVAGK